ncbi:unnamed protein product [Medioppia subpectinata]|uniref:Uncharacterized protein n=1 Tax=Medioppia subpectinata TaxID=1979941 RepID=A0A7R9Q6A6_9ACAR|nr:unnamed protein product [Medioppia subpectinata]CAG2114662.1 unnamed protein product [Medioppia subpectinata]
MIEMNKLFRHLFPLVPDKAHYIWKASHHGGASLGGSFGGPLGGALTLDQPNRHHNSFIDHIENPITRHSSTPQSEANANIRDQQQYDDQSVTVPTSPPHPPVISPILTNNFKHIIKSGRRMQTPLGKRGPEYTNSRKLKSTDVTEWPKTSTLTLTLIVIQIY